MYRGRHRPGPAGFAAIAQLVEHVIRNDGVGGSSPSCGTIFRFSTRHLPHRRSAVARACCAARNRSFALSWSSRLGRIFLPAFRISAPRSLAISAHLARTPQPGSVRALIDIEPATAGRLAATNSSRVCRRQNGAQRPQQRPKWFADITPRKVVQEHSATANKTRLRRRLREKLVHETQVWLPIAAQGVTNLPDILTQGHKFCQCRSPGGWLPLVGRNQTLDRRRRHDSATRAPSEERGVIGYQLLRIVRCSPVKRVPEIQANAPAKKLRCCSEGIP